MENHPSLAVLMRNHTVTAAAFFSVPTIAQQVRNNLPRFARFVRTHKQFAQQLIQLAYNTPPQYLETPELRNAVHAATDVLASEDTPIAELFLEPEGEDIPEEINGIQSEAQRLFEDEQAATETEQVDRPVELEKGELLCASLEGFKEAEPNETCLGHLQKLFSFLVRTNPNAVLEFFQTHPEQRDILLGALQHGAASTILSQMLTCEDKTKEYAFESLKRSLLMHALESLLSHADDEFYFDGAMVLFEEVLNTTKQSYYEYFEDFKRVANMLVSKDVLVRFRTLLDPKRPQAFRNASRYLEFLFTRINSEREDNSYYSRGEETEPTMEFEVDQFYEELPQLIELTGSIGHTPTMAKIAYLSFLEALLIAFRANNRTYSLLHPSFLTIMNTLNNEKSTGVYKIKLHTLASSLISKSGEEEVGEFLRANPDLYSSDFAAIRTANYGNTNAYNRNEAAAFDLSLINEMSKKSGEVIEEASRVMKKDFKRMVKKYNTKIASFQGNSNPLEDSDNIEGKVELPSNFSFSTIAGKGIPTLALPKTKQQREEPQESREEPREDRREVEVVEEVEVITERLEIMELRDEDKIQVPQLKPDNFDYDKVSPEKKHHNSPVAEKEVEAQPVGMSAAQRAERVQFYARHLAIYA